MASCYVYGRYGAPPPLTLRSSSVLCLTDTDFHEFMSAKTAFFFVVVVVVVVVRDD